MQSVGIELILKENLADRLGKILPIVEKMDKMFSKMNQTLSVLESSQKRVDQQFKNIGRSVDAVSQKERGLKSINTNMQGIEKSVRATTGATGLLGTALQNLSKYVAPLMGLVGVYKLVQGIGVLGGEGVAFEKNVSRLQLSQYTPKQRMQAERKAIELAQSGKYAMTGAQNLDYVLRGGAISADRQGVVDSMEMMNKIDMAMRKLKVEDALEGQTPFLMNQIWEKLGDRTTKQKQETADLLAQFEGYYAGQVPLSQFSRQLQRTRGAKLGAKKEGLFGQLFHGISEQLTAGGGGGGQGGIGAGYLALDTLLSGKMSKQQQEIWDAAGLFPGLHDFAKKKGSMRPKYLVQDKFGTHTIYSASKAGSGAVSYDFNQYLAQKPPPWYDLAGEDQRVFMQQILAPAIEGYFKLKPGGFKQQREVEQKRMVRRFFPGATNTAIGQVIENITGRYSQTVAAQQAGVVKQPGIEGVLNARTSIEDRWAQLFNSFTALGSALGENKKIVDDANRFIKGLTDAVNVLNRNVEPIANVLDGIFKLMGGVVTDPFHAPAYAGMAMGDSIRGTATKGWHGVLDMVRGKSNLSFGPPPRIPGQSSNSPTNLVDVRNLPVDNLTPPGWGSMSVEQRNKWAQTHVPDMSDLTGPGPSTKRTAINKVPPSVQSPTHTFAPPDASKSVTHGVINLIQNFHPFSGTDHNKSAKAAADAIAPHIEKKQLKTARQMSYATSKAGGSYTDSVHNAGGNQD